MFVKRMCRYEGVLKVWPSFARPLPLFERSFASDTQECLDVMHEKSHRICGTCFTALCRSAVLKRHETCRNPRYTKAVRGRTAIPNISKRHESCRTPKVRGRVVNLKRQRIAGRLCTALLHRHFPRMFACEDTLRSENIVPL